MTLLFGVLCAGAGGEAFVRGAVGLARWARISPAIIGSTIAAFATSSPELSVSVRSALARTPQIALGDALGSNVVNIALILALPIVIGGLVAPRASLRRDFPAACVVPIITAVMLSDGRLSRIDGAALLIFFSIWLTLTILEAGKQRRAADPALNLPDRPKRWWHPAAFCLLGLTLLVAAGGLIVAGASGLAAAMGLDAFIIGAVVVAVGTSMPELATALVSKLRGEDELGLATLLGSNIFNGLFIIGVASSIHPIEVALDEVEVTLAFGLAVVIAAFPPRSGRLSRRRGVILLAIYAAYLTTLLLAGARH